MDPCPELTKEQVAICKGFDYGDKTLKLPSKSWQIPIVMHVVLFLGVFFMIAGMDEKCAEDIEEDCSSSSSSSASSSSGS